MRAANTRASFWPAAEPLRAPTIGDHRARQVGGVALDVEQRRRCIDGGQRRRVAGLDGEEGARADPVGGLELGRACASGQMRIDCRPPRRGQFRQRRQRGLAPPKWLMSSRKVTGADVVAADQSQAGQALGSVERRLR
jgi:hypothetical protein